jgi:hypothetical protein
MLFKNSVCTSKRTPHFTIRKIIWLMLFKEIIFNYPFEDETRERKSIILLEGSQATPAPPSGRNNVKVKSFSDRGWLQTKSGILNF